MIEEGAVVRCNGDWLERKGLGILAREIGRVIDIINVTDDNGESMRFAIIFWPALRQFTTVNVDNLREIQ